MPQRIGRKQMETNIDHLNAGWAAKRREAKANGRIVTCECSVDPPRTAWECQQWNAEHNPEYPQFSDKPCDCDCHWPPDEENDWEPIAPGDYPCYGR